MTQTVGHVTSSRRAAISLLALVPVLGGHTWAMGSGRPPGDLEQCIQAAELGARATGLSLATPASRVPDGRPASLSPGEIAARVETCMAAKLHRVARSSGQLNAATPTALRSDIPAAERAALIALYSSTNGAGWSNRTNWRNAGDTDFNDPTTECTWYGVQCNTEGTHVTTVTLSSNQLTGTIPPELGSLTNLWYLDLADNQLTGSIPPELGSLTNLGYLDLYVNQLTGSIPPGLGSLVSLQRLDLSGNQLSGSIPPALGSLTNLSRLNLSSNQLTGSIPPELGSLTNLRGLVLASNQLTGVVPSSLASLTSLDPGGGEFRWNGLHTPDPALVTFLNSKQAGGDWQSTQTVPVTGLGTGVATNSSVALTWTPITYTGDPGGYQVSYSTASGGPWTLSGTTTDKSASGWTVTGLNPATPYVFIVKSVTNPHGNNVNTVVSDPSPEVSTPTLAGPDPRVTLAAPAAPVVQGQDFIYQATVHNGGTTTAEGVVLSLWPPIGGAVLGVVSASQGSCSGTYPVTCTLGGLATGAQATVTLHVVPGSGGTLPFRASVAADADVDPDNNTVSLQTECLSARTGSTGVNTWTPLGPDGGQVYSFGLDPLNHQVVYAATLSGAFKTTDRGAHWTRVFADAVAVVAPHPTVAGTVFLANRNRQIFKSTDGGATWTASGSGITPFTSGTITGSFLFWPGDAGTLFFSRYDSLYKSTDGGGTWTAMNTANALTGKLIGDLIVDAADPSLALYARTLNGGGLFKSTDGGATWIAVNTGLPVSSGSRINANSLALVAGSPATLLVVMSSGVVYASTDGGASWAARSGAIQTLNTLVAGAGDTTVHAIGSDYGGATPSGKRALWVSDDTGATWSILTTSYSLGALAIDPADPSFCFLGMAEGVYVSADAGHAWSPASTGLRAEDFGTGNVAFQPGTPATWYAHGGAAGIFKTADGGATFANVTANLVSPVNGSMAVDPNTPTTVYSAGQVSPDYDPTYFIYFTKSTDGGATWSRVPSPDPEAYWNLQPWGLLALPTVPTTVYVGAPGEGVFKSTDGGETFVRSSAGLPDGTSNSTNLWLQDLVPADAAGSALYAATNPGVFKSTDQAATWAPASTGLPGPTPRVRKLAVNPADPDTLYCVASGGIYKSVDGGGLWATANTGWPVQSDGVTPYVPSTIAIDPVDPNVLYATASINNVGKVYSSRDAGGSWWPLNGDAGLDAVAVWRLDIDPADHTHLIASARGGLYDTRLDLRRLSVTTSGTGVGTVTSAPGGIGCGSACFGDFAVSSVVTLTATPNANATFGGWSGACTGTGACTVTMDAARAVGAAFDLNPAPFITSADHAAFTTGLAGSFAVIATGVPTPSLASTGTLPAGLSFTDHGDGSATLGGTPGAGTSGSYLLTFTAHNGVGVDATQVFTLTVNQPAAITSADHATFVVDVPGGLTITTTGLPAPTLALTGALPTGVTFVDHANGTGTLAGTPGPGTAGNYVVTFTAHNGVATDATQTFTLTVVPLETGDINGDTQTNVQDVFYLINILFAGGPGPIGPADVNGDGQANVQDVFYLINYLFAGGPAPV